METSVIIGMVSATVLGSLLGLERSVSGKHAGMRTYALVSLGAALFSAVGVLASYKLALFSGTNPLQIAGSVAIGIGFIGAGLSAMRGDHAELTTAAGIWLAAAVGVACGLGFFSIAVVSTVLGILIFSVFTRVEHAISSRYRTQGGE
ncbi:MgtC/SapB family protein [Candidatus Nomurabacteria bacterium]|nr:MgtC/SapB family protein [Candidatus Nomurabacteria bacterium]